MDQPARRVAYGSLNSECRCLTLVDTFRGWRYFDTTGIPQSDAVEMLERFTPSEDGSRLDYTMTPTDPETFNGPVVLEKSWVWLPEVRVEPYDCRP